MGMARGSVDQSRFAAGEMFPENERARMIGRLVFAGTIGAVAGPALVTPSGELMQAQGFDVVTGPFAAMSVLCALAAVITFLLLRPDPMNIGQEIAADENSKREVDTRPARPLPALLMQPKVQLGIAAALISQTVMVVLMVMTPLYIHRLSH
jgi:predicted MFS family arabinose efflux permease